MLTLRIKKNSKWKQLYSPDPHIRYILAYGPRLGGKSYRASHSAIARLGSGEYYRAYIMRNVLDSVRDSVVGGNVNIYNNIVKDPQYYGILVNADGFNSLKWGTLVNINNNTIINPNTAAVATLNIGTGVIVPTGINVPQGNQIKINDNMIIDNRTVPVITHAVQVGHATASGFHSVARNVYVYDNITNVTNQLLLSGGVINSYVR